METMSGFIAEFDKPMIVHQDVRYFGQVRDDLLNLTLTHRRLSVVEIVIDGYNDDARSLYEVPEVRRWFSLVRDAWPDTLFWLTPGALWVANLSLNPQMHQRLPDGRARIELDPDQLSLEFATSQVEAEAALKSAGLSATDVQRAGKQAQANLIQMFQRKRLGDYVVVHPTNGDVTTYRRKSD
jgi:hypothetical protein